MRSALPKTDCRHRHMKATVLIIGSLLVSSAPSAAAERCAGPSECCPAERASGAIHDKADVSLGVVVTGLYNVNEKAGTWDADYYLYEHWKPKPGFFPQTELVNEVTRQSEQFDEVELRAGECIRTRRIYSTLHNDYNLRRFPFDRQYLVLTLSDADYDSRAVSYSQGPYAAGIADDARHALSSWKIEGNLSYSRESKAFAFEPSAPSYDYATFTFEIRRHVTHHLTKFFLPLLIVVVLAFLVFWIESDDLSSQVTIGITCVLAAIAFQFVQAANLPEVAYTTLADRVYAVCYLAIALALIETVYTHSLARHDRRSAAATIDRRARWLFPLLTTAALIVVTIWSFRS